MSTRLAMAGGTGCSWTDKGGTHHRIVGIGVITITNRLGVEVRDSRIPGGEFAQDGVGLGWMEDHRTAIDPSVASNVVISVKASGLNVTIQNFDFDGTNQNNSYQPTWQKNQTNKNTSCYP